MDFIISTESLSDLTKGYCDEKGIAVIGVPYYVGGISYVEYTDNSMTPEKMYKMMREGAQPGTSQISKYSAKLYFEELLKTGKDVLHISFASACSGTCDNMISAADELNSSYENKVYVIDSKAECLGQGLIVDIVYDYAQTHSVKEAYEYAETVREKVNMLFTVEDLKYLSYGGRVSKTKAFFGNLLNIKPLLYVPSSGELVPYGKVISRKSSLAKLAQKTIDKYNGEYKKIYVGHADCEEDAVFVANRLSCLDAKVEIREIGPVIGAHSGPGTLAIFFTANDRNV